MIPQFEPWLGEEEVLAVAEVLRSNWITEGEKTRQWERSIAQLCGVKHAMPAPNGTLALYLALKAIGVDKGDEVIVPDFTFIATANSVVMAGATPVLVDVDVRTFNMDHEKLEEAITPRTKAIMPVHIYGQPADMDAIGDIARRRGISIIEDAAQGIGVSFRGKPVGSFGLAGCLSFFADKTITTGEGGMILTDDDELAERCRILRNQGRPERGPYVHPHIGFNFRTTDVQSAIGLAQLAKLDSIITRKRRNAELYRTLLGDVEGVEFPCVEVRGFNVPFRVNVLVKDPETLMHYLEREGIGARRFFCPLHVQPCYRTYAMNGDFPSATAAYERGLSLPSAATLTETEIELVCRKVRLFFEHCRP